MSIAEDMIDGSCCSLCGCYFMGEDEVGLFTHGYPVYCSDCWYPGCNHAKALVETF